MARSFSTGNYLTRATPANYPNAGSIFYRFKPSWTSGDGASHAIFRLYNASPLQLLDFQKFSDNRMYCGWYNAPQDFRINIADPGLFTSGAWANWIIDWNAGDVTHLYKNNNLEATQSFAGAASVPTGMDSLFIGSDESGDSADGDGAEWALYDHVLDSTERALLQTTGNPTCVTGLLVHYKILGNDSPEPDEIGTEDLTLVGTPAQSTHPTVDSCAGEQTITLPLLAAAGLFHEPTVTPGTATVTLPLLAAAGSFFDPTITPGAVTVTLPLLAADGQFFEPSIAFDQTVTLPLLPAAGQFFSPTIGVPIAKGLTVTIGDRLASG